MFVVFSGFSRILMVCGGHIFSGEAKKAAEDQAYGLRAGNLTIRHTKNHDHPQTMLSAF